MTLIFHEHPLSSFCWKAKIALYEIGAAFDARLVDLTEAESRAAFFALWPIGKMPVLEDAGRGAIIPETSVIIEYLQAFHAPPGALISEDPTVAVRARLLDRVFDLYVNVPMGRIVAENFRGGADPVGVAEADALLARTYDYLETELSGRRWAAGDDFGLADCAAAPALFYADKVLPYRADHPALAAYYDRLAMRPSFVRTLEEAQPYMHFFPGRAA
jgi:glutathione S-transferase